MGVYYRNSSKQFCPANSAQIDDNRPSAVNQAGTVENESAQNRPNRPKKLQQVRFFTFLSANFSRHNAVSALPKERGRVLTSNVWHSWRARRKSTPAARYNTWHGTKARNTHTKQLISKTEYWNFEIKKWIKKEIIILYPSTRSFSLIFIFYIVIVWSVWYVPGRRWRSLNPPLLRMQEEFSSNDWHRLRTRKDFLNTRIHFHTDYVSFSSCFSLA